MNKNLTTREVFPVVLLYSPQLEITSVSNSRRLGKLIMVIHSMGYHTNTKNGFSMRICWHDFKGERHTMEELLSG